MPRPSRSRTRKRGYGHHVAPFVTESQRHFLDRDLELVLLVRFAPEHFESLGNEFERRIAAFDEKFTALRVSRD